MRYLIRYSMNRTHNLKNTSQLAHQEVSRKIAIHEAGHAAAIYLGNQQKGLPPVFFQIFIKPLINDVQSSAFLGNPSDHYIAKVEGGRLIHTLPSSLDEATKEFSTAQKHAYQHAFEADIINLLAGPLAEARYVALRDNEPINSELVNVNALQYYGGSSDLEIVNEYLECFIDSDELRERKMTELFLAAFNFVSERPNWLAITALADFILANEENIIECNEIIDVIDSGVRRMATSQSIASFG
ncbi:MAG: hypothetical protein PSU93_13210 [Methylobacter sp.]|uniref:Peptidase M41 domain-containing protein n=1 Tax=Candidatus Methylobacter titanis TaxID=3053457 RepID=A0AA43Q5R8_9GAMM|nr:hypothetical protein [Candidatus Methylobacter titanis]